MSNINIVKKAIKESKYFDNDYVSHNSSNLEVKIVTRKIFIRVSELNQLRNIIEVMGGNVDDIYVSTMPSLNHDMCIVVEFK